MPLSAPSPLAKQSDTVNERLVSELYERGVASLATLLVLALLYRILLHPVFPGVPSLNRVFWVFIGLIATRALLLIVNRRVWSRLSVNVRWILFEIGVLATSSCLAYFVVASYRHLDSTRISILAIIVSGITAAAVSSLGSSFTIYMSFMTPPMAAFILESLMTGPRDERSLELVVIMTAYMIAMTVLSLDHCQSRRRSVELALRLESQAIRDDLTGLHNRRYLQEYMQSEGARLLRETTVGLRKGRSGELLSAGLFIVDLDEFKEVNDSHGHAAGDGVLKATADALTRALRKSDLIVRWGGDEFVIVGLVSDRDDAALLAERLRFEVAALPTNKLEGGGSGSMCSVGYAVFPFFPKKPAALNWEQVLGLADLAMYIAKKEGRNRCVGVFPGEAPWADVVSTLSTIKHDPQLAGERGLIALERARK